MYEQYVQDIYRMNYNTEIYQMNYNTEIYRRYTVLTIYIFVLGWSANGCGDWVKFTDIGRDGEVKRDGAWR